MTAYFIRRFLLIIPTFLGITILVFVVTRMVPGGPIERMLTEAQFASGDQVSFQSNNQGMAGSTLSESQLNQLKEYYGFDKPVLESYAIWLKNILLLDLGYSTRYGEPVWESIKQRLPISIYCGFMTMLLTYLVCPTTRAVVVRMDMPCAPTREILASRLWEHHLLHPASRRLFG